MFTSLKALAHSAPLMITIGSAADDQLRVSISQIHTGEAPKSALKPLMLTGTAAELDADFITAIEIWHAPKRSIIEQAKAAADGDNDDDDEAEQPGAPAQRKARANAAKPKEEKPARGKKATETPPPAPAAAPAATTPPDTTNQAAGVELAPTPTPASGPAVDTATLNLF